MSEDLNETIQEHLDDLQETLSNIGEEKENISVDIPSPDFPTEHDLDQFESLLVDAILWREDAAQTKVKFAKTELESCKLMRQNLMAKLVNRLEVGLETHTVSINQDTRKATIVKR